MGGEEEDEEGKEEGEKKEKFGSKKAGILASKVINNQVHSSKGTKRDFREQVRRSLFRLLLQAQNNR